jgi:hypothetical protein
MANAISDKPGPFDPKAYVGLTVEEAEAKASSFGFYVQVWDPALASTLDLVPKRLTLFLGPDSRVMRVERG